MIQRVDIMVPNKFNHLNLTIAKKTCSIIYIKKITKVGAVQFPCTQVTHTPMGKESCMHHIFFFFVELLFNPYLDY